MAPSSRSRATKGKVQSTNAFRVTKSATLNVQPQATKQKLQAIEQVVCPKQKPQIQQNLKKRRHDALDSDRENEEVATRPQRALKKARPTTTKIAAIDPRQSKLQLQTPPPSSPESDDLPAALEELVTLHKSFTQALAVHYAHNGPRNAVLLGDLTPAMTRLWKRRTVCQQDIQRLLAIWEVRPKNKQPEREVEHKAGPFRLLATGTGSGSQVKIEYAWTHSGSFIESELHERFEKVVEKIYKSAKNEPDSFAFAAITNFPLLKCQVGDQTQAQKEKISLIRDQILSKPSQPTSSTQPHSLDLSTLDISDPSDPKPTPRETALKSRTISLFDRLRAKQLANSATAAPTSAELLRRRALHRMPDIIDVLRLKQARKLSSQFRTDIQGSSSGAASMMRVSFSLDALVQEIRDSGKTNIAPEEVKECISILGKEVPDAWCNLYVSGDVNCVTLQGEGWKKEEIKEWCEKEISKIGTAR